VDVEVAVLTIRYMVQFLRLLVILKR
jgi:hypothetical protein